MKVKLKLFAALRDVVGEAEQELSLDENTRAADVWARLREQHESLQRFDQPMTAVNQEYVASDALLCDGDELAFIPPVSGGV